MDLHAFKTNKKRPSDMDGLFLFQDGFNELLVIAGFKLFPSLKNFDFSLSTTLQRGKFSGGL
jgi:hypothetical protein